MRKFRTAIFWLHLVLGILGGLVILMMCVTGALLSFQKNITELAESDQRSVEVGERRLAPSELLNKASAAKPDGKIASISVKDDPAAAVSVSFGRDGQLFMDPYTGEVTGEGSGRIRSFFDTVTGLHRWFALSGDGRDVGRAITGASNLMFVFLAVSGIYIWFPRNLKWSAIKPNLWFRRTSSGKARDFNWHNTIGWWCSLVLIVLTVTGVVISYQWAGNLLYTLTGNEVPQRQPAPTRTAQKEEIAAVPDNLDVLWSRAESQVESWKSMSLRLPAGKEAAFTIDEGTSWNIFARSTLTLDAATASIAKWDRYEERNAAQKLRSWFRFTHTGESFGLIGQAIGFVACLGGAVLVYTGLSLSVRRFSGWRRKRSLA